MYIQLKDVKDFQTNNYKNDGFIYKSQRSKFRSLNRIITLLFIIFGIVILGIFLRLLWSNFQKYMFYYRTSNAVVYINNEPVSIKNVTAKMEEMKKQRGIVEKDLNEYRPRNNQHLDALAPVINAENQEINKNINKQGNGISEILDNEDIDFLERVTGRKILFACYNSFTNIGMFGCTFHSLCDYYTGTITVVKTKEGIIWGGYTSWSWDGDKKKYDNDAFIFNLKDRKIFLSSSKDYAINTMKNELPLFGNDLALAQDWQYTMFPDTYGKPNAKNEDFYVQYKRVIDVDVVEVLVLSQ